MVVSSYCSNKEMKRKRDWGRKGEEPLPYSLEQAVKKLDYEMQNKGENCCGRVELMVKEPN